jgi:hypothetical protein
MKPNVCFLLICLTMFSVSRAEEGMYPVSDIAGLNLTGKGLQIDPSEIYNPRGTSLIDGIVKVNGCSGSFVSPRGLILTNHHCAYGALQTASSGENNLIEIGFLAKMPAEELPAKGYTVRITESYRDISEEVLKAAEGISDLARRTDAIDQKIKQIINETEQKNPAKRAEVSEMFIGETYWLFIYTYLKDVRVAYAPPRSIGEFGGEFDNWEWPRHTGDFTFMRVYVAPDGSPAEYSPENIPFQPKKYFQVQPAGVNEGDFVFILGYPGKTYRHRTSHYIAYNEEVNLPYRVDLYDWEISKMEEIGENNPEAALKNASKIKGRSNSLKRSRGQLQGLKKLHLAAHKRLQEKALQAFIELGSERNEQYGSILNKIGRVYEEMRGKAPYELALYHLPRSSDLFYFAKTIYEASIERQKKDVKRASAYMERNFHKTREKIRLKLQNYDEATDRLLFKNILMRLLDTSKGAKLSALSDLAQQIKDEKAVEHFINRLYSGKDLTNEDFLMRSLEKTSGEIESINDPMIQFAVRLYPAYEELKEVKKRRQGALSERYGALIDVKKEFLKTDFIPDANGTLRLTYGRVRGYSPADAVLMSPITTVEGVIEKTTAQEPFDTPAKLIELYNKKEYGRFVHPQLNSLPVAILYDTDTTGGNSGSAVLNSRGQVVGVNFDRTYRATINDYAWDESYSRSIGVDIRYVLWVTQKFGGADYLLKEMNLKPL